MSGLAEAAELKATIEGLTRSRRDAEADPNTQPMKRWLTPIFVGTLLLAAAVSAVLVSSPPGSKTDGEADAKAIQTTAALAKSEQARRAAEAKVDAAVTALDQSEQARQAAGAKAAQATAALSKSEQARQAAETKAADLEKARQAAAAKADDAEKARQAVAAKADQATAALSKSEQARQAAEVKAADADKARQTAEAKVAQGSGVRAENIGPSTTVTSSAFTRRINMEAKSNALEPSTVVGSTDACERKCAQNNAYKIFTYLKPNGLCYLYSSADLVANDLFDSGIRATVATVTSSPFTSRRNMEARARGSPGAYSSVVVASADVCEQNCTRAAECNVFTYNKKNGACYMYRIADLVTNEDYDSGIRK